MFGLVFFVFALAIGMFIGAIIIRAAVALYNKMAGGASSPSSVPEPAIGKAMWITFVIGLVQMVVGFLIGLVTGAGAAGANGSGSIICRLNDRPSWLSSISWTLDSTSTP